jgi:hypothetical protein
LSKTGGEVETGASRRNEELNHIEEEREESGSREPTMADSEHGSNSNKSGSTEEPKEDSISTISLDCGFCTLGSDTYLGYFKNGKRICGNQ